MSEPTLRVKGLAVTTGAGDGERRLLDGISFTLERGGSIGLVGSSGAGKSTLGLALMRLLPDGILRVAGADVSLDGIDLLALREPEMRALRGRRIAMIFQEPMQALNPSMSAGDHLMESLIVHRIAHGSEAHERAVAMLDRVGIANARRAASMFPHEFSGGMRQRLLVASALLLAPDVLIADEPTTALDPTVQAQVLDLIDSMRRESGSALILISHDLDVVGERCDRLIVMDEGRIVEQGPAREVIEQPRAPATRRLAGARLLRGVGTPVERTGEGTPLLDISDLTVRYPLRRPLDRRGALHAVESVSLRIARGEALGLVGESGCGKSSLAHAILRLVPVHGGAVRFDGEDLLALRGESLRRMRRRIQLVPQDAGASLTPQMTIIDAVTEGMEVHGIARGHEARVRALALLDEMGLPARAAAAYPRELSAGERQRASIARALSTGPDLLICDEPVASVDAPVRAMLLDLLDRLRRERGLSLLFISHDLAAVGRIASRIAVMYLGRIVELGTSAHLLAHARMPYTQALLSAVPTGDPATSARRIVLTGELPSSFEPVAGCAFYPRCQQPSKDAECVGARPPLTASNGAGHVAACWKQV